MEPVTLRTARFVLSPPRADDVDAVYAACQDTELQRFTTVPVPYERTHAEGFVLELVPQWWRDDIEYVFGIRSAEDAPLMGVVSWQRERGFIGYWLAAEHRGIGVMTEAVRGLITWIFSHEEIALVKWECHAGNLGSAIVAQRAGFRWRGEGECAVLDRDGRHPWGWLGELERNEFGSAQARSEWPVLQ